jgi:Sulfotransferase family
MQAGFETRTIRIRPLDRDTSVAAPSPDVWVEVRSADLDGGPPPKTWGFVRSAELLVPSLLDLPARTIGAFTELAVDVYAPMFPERPECTYEVDLLLRGAVIDTKIFRNFTQRHQFIVSTQLLFEDVNLLTLSARPISGGADEPRFFVRVFYVQKDRLVRILEKSSIWVFSTARSGSTWLSQDILCWDGQARPMDEPGLGKMFAPLDWVAERFYDLAGRATYLESGLDFESKVLARNDQTTMAPFERSFIFAGQENQIWNAQNWKMYLGLLKETAFQHVINEWGMIDYERVVFKMPNDSHAADVIMQAFPESFMILLMRDGRDVLKSRFSPFGSPDLAETKDAQLRLHAIAFYSHFWNFQVDIMQSAFLAHAPERSLLVHYEDLRRQPSDGIRLIFDRIGVPLSDEDLAKLVARTSLENIPADQKGPDKPRQTGQVGKYADVFSEQEVSLMEAIMGPNLLRFGYVLQGDITTDTSTNTFLDGDWPGADGLSEVLGPSKSVAVLPHFPSNDYARSGFPDGT